MIGQRFGKLVVVMQGIFDVKSKQHRLACRCDCGNDSWALEHNLRRGRTKSCGCGKGRRIHGGASNTNRDPEYSIWSAMKDRCSNPNNPRYKHYGARGIQVCPRWLESYGNFIADMGRRPDGAEKLTIERVNNDRGYEPGNCVWATYSVQNRNRRAPA